MSIWSDDLKVFGNAYKEDGEPIFFIAKMKHAKIGWNLKDGMKDIHQVEVDTDGFNENHPLSTLKFTQ